MARMTSALLVLTLSLLLGSPASAASALPPCGGGGLGFGSHSSPVEPDYTPFLGTVDYDFRIDLSDQEVPEGEEPISQADVTVVLSWDGTPVSDYDMTVNGTDVWNNAIPPQNFETFTLNNFQHCGFIDVTVWTWIGTPIDAVTLTLDVAA